MMSRLVLRSLIWGAAFWREILLCCFLAGKPYGLPHQRIEIHESKRRFWREKSYVAFLAGERYLASWRETHESERCFLAGEALSGS
jgi:hypothetical protein